MQDEKGKNVVSNEAIKKRKNMRSLFSLQNLHMKFQGPELNFQGTGILVDWIQFITQWSITRTIFDATSPKVNKHSLYDMGTV